MQNNMRMTAASGPRSSAQPTAPQRPLVLRVGKKLRYYVDAVVARSSLVPNDPVLDARSFKWTALLRDEWHEIRQEALAVTRRTDAVPALNVISPDHKRIAADDKWRSFFLIGYGTPIAENLARCPRTSALLEQVPGLNSAFFSILKPGAHIPDHRGVTKGLLTFHLGLQVPRSRSLRMRVGTDMVCWAEGETLVFDDTHRHEVWNDTDETRIVLLIQFERPLAQPGRALARAFLGGIRRSPFVKEATANITKWEENMRKMDTSAN